MIRCFLHHYHYYRLLGQPFARAVRSAWRMRAATPREDTHGAAWPLLTIGVLCLIPALLLALGAWLFGWKAALASAALFVLGNTSWALVQAMLRRTRR